MRVFRVKSELKGALLGWSQTYGEGVLGLRTVKSFLVEVM
jgi:hypothetical protein